MCRMWVRIIHLTMSPTRHISEWKYAPTHGTFLSFFEMDKTAYAYSLQIYDYLSQIQRNTKAFLLIVRHNTEETPISDWQWRYRMLFFFVGSQNRVNLVLFFNPWFVPRCIKLGIETDSAIWWRKRTGVMLPRGAEEAGC